jgi:uncharacterized damage-inducible protein DinB
MTTATRSELIAVNIGLLAQARSLVARLDDATFATSPAGLAPHCVGSHLRHVLEFYQCFLAGLEAGRVDYDARKHDPACERSRRAADSEIAVVIQSLEDASELPEELELAVHAEDAAESYDLKSSLGRELQALSSHTIHHFALISVTLRMHGVTVDPEFGMSPSTLRFRAAQRELGS